MSSFGGTVKLTGESEYKSALTSITNSLKMLNSEMKVVTSQYDKNDTSVDNLSQQNEVLNKKLIEQQSKVGVLTSALAQAEQETGENSETSKKWRAELNNAQAELNKLNRELTDNSGKLATAKAKEEEFANQNKYAINNVRDFAVELAKGVVGISDFGETVKSDLTERVKSAKEGIKNFGTSVADAVTHPQKLGEAIKGKLVGAVEKLSAPVEESTEAIDEFGREAEDSSGSALKLGDIIKANLISEGIMAGIKGLASAIKGVGSAFLDIGKQAIQSYAEYEQLVGGVDTLFKDSSQKVQEYASNAYKTAGLSANEYMETVTSFSASLLQSLDGDTAQSADIANMAIIDMADNANKMGTSMESIQNAYQGFAKGNYTMLDNLKLGYGGTATEMARLINDSGVLGDKMIDLADKQNIGNALQEVGYAKMIEAIHKVQGEMGITGTTSLEASKTISGSTGSMKSAWDNLVTGIADDNADFETLVNNLVVSIVGVDGEGGVLNNLLPRIETAMDGIVQMVVSLTENLLPQIMQLAVDLIITLATGISENLPTLLESAGEILNTLIDGIVSILPTLIPVALDLIMTLTTAILNNLPTILDMGIKMLMSLVQGISSMLPELIPLAIDAVLNLVETLLDNIDLIIDTGMGLLLALADGLLDALPKFIEKAPVIIDKLITAISNNMPKIIETGIELTIQLAWGLIKAIPQLVSKIPQIITSLVNGFNNYWSKIGDIGKNLVDGIWEGINGSIDWIKNKIKGWVGDVTSFIKKVLGINSPSRVFKEEIGTNMALGVGEGFADTMEDVSKEMGDAIPTEFDADISTNINAGAGYSTNSNYNMMVSAFKQALTEVKVVMNNREMGAFVTDTVERVVYA